MKDNFYNEITDCIEEEEECMNQNFSYNGYQNNNTYESRSINEEISRNLMNNFKLSQKQSPPGIDYAYIYNLSPQVVEIEHDIKFSDNIMFTSGIIHAANTEQIIITNPGTYAILFYITGIQSDQFILFQNNVPVKKSEIVNKSSVNLVITTLKKNDILTLRNNTSVSNIILNQTSGGDITIVNAYIFIQKML